MATFEATISGLRLRKETIEQTLEKMSGVAHVAVVKKAKTPKSRAERFSAALSLLEDAKSEMESLREELQEWRDGIPENLQNGDKAAELDDAIGSLDDLIGDLDNVLEYEVSFPGMY